MASCRKPLKTMQLLIQAAMDGYMSEWLDTYGTGAGIIWVGHTVIFFHTSQNYYDTKLLIQQIISLKQINKIIAGTTITW